MIFIDSYRNNSDRIISKENFLLSSISKNTVIVITQIILDMIIILIFVNEYISQLSFLQLSFYLNIQPINEDLIIEDVSVSPNDYDKIIIINITYSPNYLINKLLRFFYFYFLSLFLILVTNTKPDTNKITLLYY